MRLLITLRFDRAVSQAVLAYLRLFDPALHVHSTTVRLCLSVPSSNWKASSALFIQYLRSPLQALPPLTATDSAQLRTVDVQTACMRSFVQREQELPEVTDRFLP